MGIDVVELGQRIIRPTLQDFHCWSEGAEKLLLGTAIMASESGSLLYHHSNSSESAHRYGIYQMTAKEHQSVWDDYLCKHIETAGKVRGLAGQRSFLNDPHAELITNLAYATAIAWFLYQQKFDQQQNDGPPLSSSSIETLSTYWYQHFPHPSHLTPQDFVKKVSKSIKNDQFAA